MGELDLLLRPHGFLYEYNEAGSGIEIVTPGTYYPWITGTAGVSSGITINAGAGTMTVPQTGVYDVLFKFVAHAPVGCLLRQAIHKNGSIVTELKAKRLVPLGDEIFANALSYDPVSGSGGASLFAPATEAEAIARLKNQDRIYVDFQEGSAAGGQKVIFTFSANHKAKTVRIYGGYVGAAAHKKKIAIYNYTTALWEDITARAGANSLDDDFIDVGASDMTNINNGVREYDISGSGMYHDDTLDEIKIAFDHYSTGVTSHHFLIDKLSLFLAYSEVIGVKTGRVNLTAGDVLDFRVTCGEAGFVYVHVMEMMARRVA